MYPTHHDNCMFCLSIIFNPCLTRLVRYQHNHLDVHHSTSMIMPQYDYGHSLNTQQPPMLHTIQQPPNSNSRHVTLSTRNHIAADFSPQSSRIPSASHVGPSSDDRSSSATAESTSPKETRKETLSVVIACRQWSVLFFPPSIFIPLLKHWILRASRYPSLVVAAKFAAIQQGPFATTVPEDLMNASMI